MAAAAAAVGVIMKAQRCGGSEPVVVGEPRVGQVKKKECNSPFIAAAMLLLLLLLLSHASRSVSQCISAR